MLFKLLRPIVTFITYQFFSEIRLTGAKRVKDGPLIIVANHPNVMLDGLLVIYNFEQELWFLAKSTLFNGRIKSWLFSLLHFVPIYRKNDAERDMDKNEQSFSAASQKLEDSKGILIFPEGVSLGDRKLNPIKTGAARIAFKAESENNFTLGLKIQALGLTYGDFLRFQSTVTATASEPILVSDYKYQYEQDPKKAVKALSKEIEDRLKIITAEVHDSNYNDLVVKISKLYKSKGVEEDDLLRIKTIAEEVKKFSKTHASQADSFKRRIDQYLHLCRSLKVDGSRSLDTTNGRLLLFFVAPFVAAGIIIHIPVFRLVKKLMNTLSSDRSQFASLQISFAFFLFPIWYFLLSSITALYLASFSAFFKMLFLISACGLLAKNYTHEIFLLTFSSLWPASRTPVEVLTDMRDDLILELDAIRKNEPEDLSS